MLRKLTGITLCALMLASCSSGSWLGKDKKDIEGDRLRILPEASDYKSISSKQQFVIASSITNSAWEPESGTCNFNASLGPSYKDSISVRLSDVSKYNEIPFAAMDGNIYIQNSSGAIIAYSKDLDILWESELKGSFLGMFDKPTLMGSVVADEDTLYVTLGNSNVVALNISDGKQKWVARLFGATRSKPVIFKDKVFIQTVDNKLAALEKSSGKAAWIHYGVSKEGGILQTSRPLVVNNIVYVNYSSGEVFALKPESGAEIWQKKLDNNIMSRRTQSDLTNSNSQIFYDENADAIIATSSKGDLIAFDSKDGELIYNKSLAISNSVWYCGSHVYFVSIDNYLTAASKIDGSIAWRMDLNKYLSDPKARVYWTPPIMVGSNILIVNSEGKALQVQPFDGSMAKESSVPNGISAQPAAVKGSLYLLGNDGYLYIYRD